MSRFVESAVLKIEDQASKQLAKITANYRKFAADIARINSKMSGGKNGGPFASGSNATAAGLRAQVRALDQGARAADRYAAAMARAASNAKATAAASRTQAAMQRQVQRLNATTGAGGYAPRPGKGGKGGAVAQGLKFGAGAEVARQVDKMIVSAAHVVVEGVKEGSGARAQFYQSGNETTTKQLAAAQAEFARRFGASSADTTRSFAEVTPFSHDFKVQKALVEQLLATESLATQRGDSPAAAHEQALKNFKGFDLAALLRPSKTGDVDTTQLAKYAEAIRAVQSMEGKNLTSGDFRNLMKYAGAHAATLSTEGAQRLLMYGSDVSGATAGVQQRALDRLIAGVYGPGSGKQALANAIKEGFAVRDKDGRMHAKDEGAYAKDPMGYIAAHGINRMKALGLDPMNTEDVSKYVQGLKFNSQVTTYLTAAINRQLESDRAIEAAKHARGSVADAEKGTRTNTNAVLKSLNSSVKTIGDRVDESAVGDLYRNVLNRFTDGLNAIVHDQSGGKMGVGTAAAGAIAVGIAKLGAHVFDNPGLSANTVALGGVTAALWANTAAQRGGLAGNALGGIAGAAGGVGGIAARLIAGVGIGSIIAAAGYVAYKGLGGGESPAVNAKTAEIVGLENRIKNLQDALGRDQTPEKRADLEGKLATAANSLEKAAGELVSLRQSEAAAKTATASVAAAEAALPATLGNLDQRQGELVAAIKSLEAKMPTAEQMPGSTKAERDAAGPTGAAAQLAKLNGELAQVREAIGRREAEQVRGDQSGFKEGKTAAAAKQIAKAGDDAGGKVKAAMDAGAQKFDGAGQKITAASAKFDATMQQVGPKIESAGTNAGNTMQRAIEAGGAAAAAKIGQAVSNISVNVNAPKASAPTGASAPGRS